MMLLHNLRTKVILPPSFHLCLFLFSISSTWYQSCTILCDLFVTILRPSSYKIWSSIFVYSANPLNNTHIQAIKILFLLYWLQCSVPVLTTLSPPICSISGVLPTIDNLFFPCPFQLATLPLCLFFFFLGVLTYIPCNSCAFTSA